jgi:hypothetical protein
MVSARKGHDGKRAKIGQKYWDIQYVMPAS